MNNYSITDKRILEDLKKSTITWSMQLEMTRKYNQGDKSFADLVAEGANLSRSRVHQIVKKISSMDIKEIERISKIAIDNDLF
jgi:predicted DNA-binding protein YlxM (UPF0122 family)